MRLFWYVAIGAAAGGVARYYLSAAIQQRVAGDFPGGTLVINVTGSLLLGFLMRWALGPAGATPEMRALLATGFCGGYTTFSTFSYETVALLQSGEYRRAALYVGASVVLSLGGTFAGFAAGSRVLTLSGRA